MGFGSNDTFGQQDRDDDTSEEDAVSVHKNDDESDVEFAADAMTDDLLAELETVRGDVEMATEFGALIPSEVYVARDPGHVLVGRDDVPGWKASSIL